MLGGSLWHVIRGVGLGLTYLSTLRPNPPCGWRTTATRGRLLGVGAQGCDLLGQYAAPQSALRLTHHSDPGGIFGGSRHSQYTAPQSALRLAHHSDPGGWGNKKGAPAVAAGAPFWWIGWRGATSWRSRRSWSWSGSGAPSRRRGSARRRIAPRPSRRGCPPGARTSGRSSPR